MFNQTNTTHSLTPSFLEENFRKIHKGGRRFEPRKRPAISSSLCPRQIAFGLNVSPHYTEMPKALPYYASIGNAIEDEVLSRYRISGQLLLSQWKLPKELTDFGLDMGGIIDAILEVDGEIIIIDVKSIGVVESEPYIPLGAGEVQNLIAGNDITIHSEDERIKSSVEKGSKEVHLAQLQLYAAITGITSVYLQMMSRRVQDKFNVSDTTPTVKFEAVPINTAILEKRVAVAFYGIECSRLGVIPDVLANIKKSHCSDAFCSFQDYCWKDSHKIQTNLRPISIEESRDLKLDAFAKAKNYISHLDERKEVTLKLIAQEKERRIKAGIKL